MSSMLEQAIVDAKALREAAVKSAESELLEKYADEMKLAVTNLLEAEADLGMMGAGAAPPTEATPAYADGENLCPCPEEQEEVEIDFADLRAQAEEAADEDWEAQLPHRDNRQVCHDAMEGTCRSLAGLGQQWLQATLLDRPGRAPPCVRSTWDNCSRV